MAKTKRKKLKDAIWKLFSQYIRLKYSKDGYCTCVTCGVSKPWKELQAGHLLDGRYESILFCEEIVFPQCYGCNVRKYGNKEVYVPWFIDKFSRELYDEVVIKKHTPFKYTIQELEDLKEHYKNILKELEK